MTNPPELEELSALYAFEVLDPDETEVVRQRVKSSNGTLDAEVEGYHHVTGALGLVVTPVDPPASLRERLMKSLARETRAKADARVLPEGLAALARANDMPWKASPFPGIRRKRLFHNTSDGTTVWLVNMDSGSFYPPHSHSAIEHTFVLQGDIVFDGYSLSAGEYQAALPGKDHEKPITTKGGCTVLIINNANDEVFAMPAV
jgi:anti-sigma factor ChrR (cupin superfamily)